MVTAIATVESIETDAHVGNFDPIGMCRHPVDAAHDRREARVAVGVDDPNGPQPRAGCHAHVSEAVVALCGDARDMGTMPKGVLVAGSIGAVDASGDAQVRMRRVDPGVDDRDVNVERGPMAVDVRSRALQPADAFEAEGHDLRELSGRHGSRPLRWRRQMECRVGYYR